jgi:hypothetical protein
MKSFCKRVSCKRPETLSKTNKNGALKKKKAVVISLLCFGIVDQNKEESMEDE